MRPSKSYIDSLYEVVCEESIGTWLFDWAVFLRPLQHTIGYMGDGFYRSKDPTNSIKVLKEKAAKENNTKNIKKTENTHTKKVHK